MPTSYGYHIAAAAAEFVWSPICSAKIEVSNPFSANRIAEVRPDTPAPITATRRSGFTPYDVGAERTRVSYIVGVVALSESSLTDKVIGGERISPEEALELYRRPLAELGQLANARRDLAKAASYDNHGREIVTYIIDRNINYTNVCNVYCKFCAFYRTEKDADHYVLSREQLDQKLDELSAAGGVQILMQGGHHPKLTFEWYIDLLRHIREK